MASASHLRSNSMPIRSHPLILRAEEEINNQKAAAEALSMSSTSPLTAQMICNGLKGLRDLYDCVDDLLRLPMTQQSLTHQHKKWAEEVLDGSIRLLDICGTTREMLLQMRENAQDLHMGLRRTRVGEPSLESMINTYICSRKKVKKDISKCLGVLKRMVDRCQVAYPMEKDQESATVVVVLREAMAVSISIFQSLLSFLSGSRTKSQKSRWSLVSKLMNKGRVACEENSMVDTNEVDDVDVLIDSIRKKTKMEKVQMTQKRLEVLKIAIEDVEGGMECTFKCLIQTRVALLNLFTH